jgi:hypothetical protein
VNIVLYFILYYRNNFLQYFDANSGVGATFQCEYCIVFYIYYGNNFLQYFDVNSGVGATFQCEYCIVFYILLW